MENFEIEKENYYTGSKLNIAKKRPNFFARVFMKIGMGKTEDQANLWVILTTMVTFGVAFIGILD